MKIAIYQINLDKDTERVAFMGYKEDRFNPTIYDRVWNGNLEVKDLEDVFRVFNLYYELPNGCHSRSLSVSDVVFFNNKYYYCDNVGWKEVKF